MRSYQLTGEIVTSSIHWFQGGMRIIPLSCCLISRVSPHTHYYKCLFKKNNKLEFKMSKYCSKTLHLLKDNTSLFRS